MISDVIQISSRGAGFADAIAETRKAAAYAGLNAQESLRLQLVGEEMLSLARSVTGEPQASFWLEAEGKEFHLHLSTRTVMDKEKRAQLLSAATSRQNEAAKTILGYLRDAFEAAMAAEPEHPENDLPLDVLSDLSNHDFQSEDWDGYERSVLRKASDEVKIAIRGGLVDMTVTKRF